jgi:hypothetical protein
MELFLRTRGKNGRNKKRSESFSIVVLSLFTITEYIYYSYSALVFCILRIDELCARCVPVEKGGGGLEWISKSWGIVYLHIFFIKSKNFLDRTVTRTAEIATRHLPPQGKFLA